MREFAEWPSCAEHHRLFNVAMDMDLKNEVNVLLKEAAAVAVEGTMIEALDDEALDDDEVADDYMALLRVFENQLKVLENVRVHGRWRAQLSKRSTRPASHTKGPRERRPTLLNVPWPTPLHKRRSSFVTGACCEAWTISPCSNRVSCMSVLTVTVTMTVVVTCGLCFFFFVTLIQGRWW